MSTIIPRDGLAPRTSWYYRSARLLLFSALLGVLLVLAVRAAEYLNYAARAIAFPFEVDYGEGIVWQQALLTPGSRMYGDITHLPFIVFHYTPVYHLVVRVATALGVDPLVAGRGVSLVAIIIIAVLAANITFAATREIASISARVVGAAVTGLMVLTYKPVQEWAVLMRVDMLAIAFSIAGIYLTIVAGPRTIALYAAVLSFVLAVYTKQTELAAPVAAIAVAAMVNVRSAVKVSAFGLFIAGAAFIMLQIVTDGGFWGHIFGYNFHNRFSFHRIIDVLLYQKHDALGLLTGLIAFAFLWWIEIDPNLARSLRTWLNAIRQSTRLRALTIISLWFILASAQLVTIGKFGSASNYCIEWMCITTVPIGMVASVVWARAAVGDKSIGLAAFTGLFLSLAVTEHALHRPLFEYAVVDDANGIALRTHLVDLIRESRKPILSEDMVLLLRAGQQVPIELAIFAELASTGIWDQRPLLNLVQDHAFGLIILLQDHDESHFTRELANALQNSYPLIERFEEYIVRRPPEP